MYEIQLQKSVVTLLVGQATVFGGYWVTGSEGVRKTSLTKITILIELSKWNIQQIVNLKILHGLVQK